MRCSFISLSIFALSALTIVSGDRSNVRRIYKRATINDPTGQSVGERVAVQDQNNNAAMMPMQSQSPNRIQGVDTSAAKVTRDEKQAKTHPSGVMIDTKEDTVVIKELNANNDPENSSISSNNVQVSTTGESGNGSVSTSGGDVTTSGNIGQVSSSSGTSDANTIPSVSGNDDNVAVAQTQQPGAQSIDSVQISSNGSTLDTNNNSTKNDATGSGNQAVENNTAQAMNPK